MVKAARGPEVWLSIPVVSTNNQAGVLVQCDASIKAIICNIDDQANHDFIIEDLDDETVFVKTDKLDELKRRLQEV